MRRHSDHVVRFEQGFLVTCISALFAIILYAIYWEFGPDAVGIAVLSTAGLIVYTYLAGTITQHVFGDEWLP